MAEKGPKARVVIIADASGYGPYYHLGDEAMAWVAIERLKAIVGPRNMVLFSPRPKTAARTYGIKAVRLPAHTRKGWLRSFIFRPLHTARRFGVMLWHIWRSRVVFFAGGGNMTNLYQSALDTRLLLLRMAKTLKKHIFLVSQTIGPLLPMDRERSRLLLADVDWLGVRDQSFSGRQLDLPVRTAPDDAVFIEPQDDAELQQIVAGLDGKVGISFHIHKGGDPADYDPLMAAAERVVLHFAATGVFVPHFNGPKASDLALAARLKEAWREASLVVIERVPRPAAALALTASFSLVLATRYHAVVFALAAGVPVVAVHSDLYTEAKMEGVFAQFGLEPCLVPMKQIHELPVVASKAIEKSALFREAAHNVRRGKINASMAPYEALATLLSPQGQQVSSISGQSVTR